MLVSRFRFRSSIHLFLLTSPSQKNARSFSLCKCLNEVRLAIRLGPFPAVREALEPSFSFHVEVLAVPKNMKLLAIPLFELYDNAARCVTIATQVLTIMHILITFCPQIRSPAFRSPTFAIPVC